MSGFEAGRLPPSHQRRLPAVVGVLLLFACVLGLGPSIGSAAINREAITSYDRMTGGAPYHSYFDNAWQGFTAQSQFITHIGVTVGNPALQTGVAVPYNVVLRLCTNQPDANGNCNAIAQASPQIVNYGNSYVDIGDVAVTPGQTYWVVWFQPPAVNGNTWVTFWWAGGPTISQSDQMQMVVTGFTPATPSGGWLGPADGSTLSGTVQLQANVTSAEQVEFDAYYATNPADVNTVGWHELGMGSDAGSDNWTLTWNSATIPDQGNAGWGTVNIVAIPIVAGQASGTRFYRRFNVANGTPPSSSPPPANPPPATTSYRYAIVNGFTVNVRAGPGTNFQGVGSLAGGTAIDIVCQTVGTNVNGSLIWDQLASGPYVSDWFTTTPVVGGYSPGIPHCVGAPAQVGPPAPVGQWSVVGSAVTLRSGPGTGYASLGSLGVGARFDISCQTYGTFVAGSPVWDQLPDGRYVSDYFTNTPVYAAFSPGIPICPGTGPRPTGGGGTTGVGGGAQPPAGVVAGNPSSCGQDIVFIGVHGAGAGPGFDQTIRVVYSHVENRFPSEVRPDGLDNDYAAIPADPVYDVTHLRADLQSVNGGTTAVLNHMQYDLDQWHPPCRPLRFVLAGYSEGAWVVGDAILQMPRSWRDLVSGVVLLGDPRNHGTPFAHGVWDAGHVFPADIAPRIRNYCHVGDPVCNATAVEVPQLLGFFQHTNYDVPGGDADQGGAFLVHQLSP